MKPITSVVIIGMGAMGILYGDFFSRKLGNEAVTFIADEKRRKRYAEEGVSCNGHPCPFRFMDPSARPAQPADLLIFATKATGLKQAIADARLHVGPDTVILSVLNGITSEEQIGEAYGDDHVLLCVAQGMDARREGHSLICPHFGQLIIGTDDPARQPKLDAVRELFDRTGMPYTAETDIRRRLWAKWLLNVGVNQVVMLEEGTYGTVQKEGPAREMMKAAMREVITVAVASGIRLSEDDVTAYLKLIGTLAPDGMPSMRQDGLAGRPTEVDFFAGALIAKAQALGIDVPVNREIYRRVREMEAAFPRG